MKRILVFYVVCLLFIVLLCGCGSDNKSEIVAESPSEPTLLTEYDDLQSIFCAISFSMTPSELEQLIADYGLEYNAKEFKGINRYYKIAYTSDVAKLNHAASGDYVEVEFDPDNDGAFMHAEYFNYEAFKTALYYRYGAYYDLVFNDSNNDYQGYYYHAPGDTKGGVTITYTNGNSKETGYKTCASAQIALSYATYVE